MVALLYGCLGLFIAYFCGLQLVFCFCCFDLRLIPLFGRVRVTLVCFVVVILVMLLGFC